MFDFSLFLLKIFLFIILAILAIIDLKTKETPYFLSFSLIISGIFALVFFVIKNFSFEIFTIAVMNTFIAFLIAYLKYKYGIWGGGDFLVFFSISFFITIIKPELFSSLVFLFFIYLATIFYNFIFLIILYVKNWMFSKYEIFFLVFLLFFLIKKDFLLALLTLMLWFFIIVHKLNTLYFIKKVKINEVKEEDWLAYDVIKENKVILKEKDVKEGLKKEDIEFLKRNKVNFVYIKDGIPYLPTFFIGYLFFLFEEKFFNFLFLFIFNF